MMENETTNTVIDENLNARTADITQEEVLATDTATTPAEVNPIVSVLKGIAALTIEQRLELYTKLGAASNNDREKASAGVDPGTGLIELAINSYNP